jgi:hypothetical protein
MYEFILKLNGEETVLTGDMETILENVEASAAQYRKSGFRVMENVVGFTAIHTATGTRVMADVRKAA